MQIPMDEWKNKRSPIVAPMSKNKLATGIKNKIKNNNPIDQVLLFMSEYIEKDINPAYIKIVSQNKGDEKSE